MIAICKSNEAFEDSLTIYKSYNLIQLANASILILNDRGEIRWYGVDKFKLATKGSLNNSGNNSMNQSFQTDPL
ncbi:hypothetical protein [Motiliproteus sp. MSK22-1]|uniref:hypothetical protein n=1 Tax=Motiliproteus sp. MSK22-1 TaxID=1897630 RepID=UPI000975C0DC|nr:hypothetical protein [Motiliproteus sp. MSK22-1]OMH32620.1 hypothetical protein BGP75_13800 [Motiliproteus sp. MSK22-1]